MSASSLYDTLRVNESSDGPDEPDFTAKSRQYIDIPDNNALNYDSGQVVFDLNALVSSLMFLDWKASYLTVPIQLLLTSTQAMAPDASNAFAASLKNGFFQIINGMSVTAANQTVVSLQQMSNIPIAYKILSTWNASDQDVLGPSIGFNKDTTGSMRWDAASGLSNNTVIPTLETLGANGVTTNVGRYSRMRDMAIPSTLQDTFQTQASNNTDTVGRSTCNNAAAATGTITYNIMATIPMRYLHDLFEKMPLARGILWQLTIHTHLPSTFTCSTTTGATMPIASMSSQTLNQFQPMMLTYPSTAANGLKLAANTGSTFTLKGSIGTSFAKSCFLHCAQYDLSPAIGKHYVDNPRKKVVYEDFLKVSPAGISAVAANGTGRANITAGLGRLRSMLIVPFLPPASNGSLGTLTDLNSAFTSSGATTAPYAYLDDFNVAVGSRNIYDKNIKYRYDSFLREQFGANSPSGNGVDGLRSGLINETDFNTGYGFVWVNLERHIESADSLPASVDIEFTNRSNVVMGYHVFLFYEKTFEIDVLTGKMII